MKKRVCCHLILGLIFFCGLPYAFTEEDQEHLKETFFREAPNAWKELREFYAKKMDAEIEKHYDDDPSKKIYVIMNESNELNHWIEKNGDEYIDVINPTYAFSLKKEGSDSWVVEEITDPVNARIDKQFTHGLLSGSVEAFGGLLMEEGWLEELVSSETFVVNSIQEKVVEDEDEEGEDDAKCIEIQFQCDHELYKYCQLIGGKMTLAPNKNWLLVDYDIETIFTYGTDGQIEKERIDRSVGEYQYQKIDNHYYPKTFDGSYTLCDPREYTIHRVITVTPNSQPSDEIFYLSYYGFSEPKLPKPIGPAIRYTFICLGLLLIAIGIYLRRCTSKA